MIVKWRGDPEILRNLFSRRPPTMPEQRRWFRAYLADESSIHFIIATKRGRSVGNANLTRIDRDNLSAEYGVMVGERDCWGRGYGTEATALALEFAFGRLELERVSLRVISANRRAVALYRRCGFRKEGVLRGARRAEAGFEDVALMSILRREWEAMRRR
jgi:RimJ/RimL family protein N-acetyltransferase